MTNNQKQQVINEATAVLKNRQWFNGVGFEGDKLIVAYNFYPALELVEFKSTMSRFGVEYELKDIRNIMPDAPNDDIPSHMRR